MRRLNLFLIFSQLFIVSLLSSCESIKIIDEGKGILQLSISGASPTKSISREFPDTNRFNLIVRKIGGQIIYEGLYGQKPKELSVPAGTYDVDIKSANFLAPLYETPLYGDSKTVVVESGKVSPISLLVKQINSAIRFTFTNSFKSRFSGYEAEVADSKGKSRYPYTESRFLYINPGQFSLRLLNLNTAGDTVKIFTKSILANNMLTINMDYLTEGESGVVPGITVDTTSVWSSEDFLYGLEKEGDGLTQESAFLTNQLTSKVGMTGVWVTGYIVGGDLTQSGAKFTTPFSSESNLIIASTNNESDRLKCISVALASGSIRTALNLVTNPTNLGKRVWLKGTIVASYFNLTGINPVTEYKLE